MLLFYFSKKFCWRVTHTATRNKCAMLEWWHLPATAYLDDYRLRSYYKLLSISWTGRFSSCLFRGELCKKRIKKNPCSSWNDRTRQFISLWTVQKIAHFMYYTISWHGLNIYTYIHLYGYIMLRVTF